MRGRATQWATTLTDGPPEGSGRRSSTSPDHAGLVLATLILVAAVANLNLAVANVALPDIGTHFDASQTGLDVVASPSLTLYYDFDEVDALYAELGVSFGSEIGDRGVEWGVDLIASFADSDFAAFYAGGVDSGLFAGTIGGSLTIPAGEIWGVSFFANYTDSLDTMVLPTQKVDFYGGISIAASF